MGEAAPPVTRAAAAATDGESERRAEDEGAALPGDRLRRIVRDRAAPLGLRVASAVRRARLRLGDGLRLLDADAVFGAALVAVGAHVDHIALVRAVRAVHANAGRAHRLIAGAADGAVERRVGREAVRPARGRVTAELRGVDRRVLEPLGPAEDVPVDRAVAAEVAARRHADDAVLHVDGGAARVALADARVADELGALRLPGGATIGHAVDEERVTAAPDARAGAGVVRRAEADREVLLPGDQLGVDARDVGRRLGGLHVVRQDEDRLIAAAEVLLVEERIGGGRIERDGVDLHDLVVIGRILAVEVGLGGDEEVLRVVGGAGLGGAALHLLGGVRHAVASREHDVRREERTGADGADRVVVDADHPGVRRVFVAALDGGPVDADRIVLPRVGRGDAAHGAHGRKSEGGTRKREGQDLTDRGAKHHSKDLHRATTREPAGRGHSRLKA